MVAVVAVGYHPYGSGLEGNETCFAHGFHNYSLRAEECEDSGFLGPIEKKPLVDRRKNCRGSLS